MPATYYLVTYIQRPNGAWASPPECEAVWASGSFRQIRFDDASHVGLVKAINNATLPNPPASPIDPGDIDTWIAGLSRQPKSYNEDGTVAEYKTASEEQADARRIGTGYY